MACRDNENQSRGGAWTQNGRFVGCGCCGPCSSQALSYLLFSRLGCLTGHLQTSPAQDSETTNPLIPDQVAIRGLTARGSLGPDDIPVGVAGWATGNALGDEGRVFAIRGAATGDAAGFHTRIAALQGVTSGNATGTRAQIRAVVGGADGNATGPNSSVNGGTFFASGNATGTGAAIRGVVGDAEALSGLAIGVFGLAETSPIGIGLFGLGPFRGAVGQAQATSGFTIGVEGQDHSDSGVGVFGRANATFGPARGVVGESFSSSGIGVHGRALGSSGSPIAVWGESLTPNGIGIQGTSGPGGRAGVFNGPVEIFCSQPTCLTVNGRGVGDLAENLPVRQGGSRRCCRLDAWRRTELRGSPSDSCLRYSRCGNRLHTAPHRPGGTG